MLASRRGVLYTSKAVRSKSSHARSQGGEQEGNGNSQSNNTRTSGKNNPDPNEIWASALGKYFENEAVAQVVEFISVDRMLAKKYPKFAEIALKTAKVLGVFNLIQAINKHTTGTLTINVGGYPAGTTALTTEKC